MGQPTVQPTVQPTNSQNQGLDSAFLNSGNNPVPNSQTGSTGPVLTQGGAQNYFPTTSQENTPQSNFNENTIPTTQNQGLDSAFLDVIKDKEISANNPVPNSQTVGNGPVLTQGGAQNYYPTNSQQNPPQTNVAENTIPTSQNSVDNGAPGAEFDLDVSLIKPKFPSVTWTFLTDDYAYF